MSENITLVLDRMVFIFDSVIAFFVAYISVGSGLFISILPLPSLLSASIFFALNLLLFLCFISAILGRKGAFNSWLAWICAFGFGVAGFLSDDKFLLMAIFCLIFGIYIWLSRDSFSSLKYFERLRIKFNQKRSKDESIN